MKQVERIKDLKVGDIIRGKSSGLAYVVTSHYGSTAIAVRTVEVSNPIEWEVMANLSQSDNQ